MTDRYIQGNPYEGRYLWWPLTALGRDCYIEVHYIVNNVGRARNWPLWAGDRFTEVTVKAGLTVHAHVLSLTFYPDLSFSKRSTLHRHIRPDMNFHF